MTSNNLNPFAAGAAAIQKRSRGGSSQLITKKSSSIDPFAPSDNLPVRRAKSRDDGLSMFEEKPRQVETRAPVSGLACQDVFHPDSDDGSPISYCVGPTDNRHEPEKITMEQSQFMGADGDMDVELVLAVYEGVCHKCTLIHHHSVSHLVDPGSHR